MLHFPLPGTIQCHESPPLGRDEQCPKHHSKYRPDGAFVSGRATRGMDRFSISRSGDEVVVDVGTMHKEDQDHAGWDAAVLHL